MTASASPVSVSKSQKPSRYFPSPERKLAEEKTKNKPEPKTLFQKYFKSVGPRTYAAQVQEASNGNHFLVLTEGKRDKKTDELRKTRLFVFSEDFEQFKDILRDAFKWIADHPVPNDVKQKQANYWRNQRNNGAQSQRRAAQ